MGSERPPRARRIVGSSRLRIQAERSDQFLASVRPMGCSCSGLPADPGCSYDLGRLAGSLTILGGTGVLTAFTWIDSPMSWLKILAYLALCFGIAVFVTSLRVRQMKVAWAVLVAD